MKDAMRVAAGSAALAILLVVTLAGGPAHSEVHENGYLQGVQADPEKSQWHRDPIVGVWNVAVVVTACDSGAPLVTFDAMSVFGADGTFHDTNANNPTIMVRSDAFGRWKHVRGNRYKFAFKVFNFDMGGMYLGYQVIRHNLVLAKDGKSYKSKGTSEFLNPDGSERPPVKVCSETTATRFR